MACDDTTPLLSLRAEPREAWQSFPFLSHSEPHLMLPFCHCEPHLMRCGNLIPSFLPLHLH